MLKIFFFKKTTASTLCKVSIATLVFSLIIIFNSKAQNQIDGLKHLKKNAVPLTIKIDDQSVNKDTYLSFFQGKELIALGESTHGTMEFNIYRDQISRALISDGSVKTIIFETDYSSLEKLNSFLLHGKSDSLLKAMSGMYGIYKTQEVYDMLMWVYNYNQSVQIEDRVEVRGADMQDPYAITKSILNNVKNLNLLNTLSLERLKKIHLLYTPAKEVKHSKADLDGYKEMVKDLYLLIDQDTNKESKMYVRLLEQTLALRETSNISQYKMQRDKFLAENVMYLYNTRPVNSKVLIWAHNGHIAHAEVSKTYRMGYYLKNKLGVKYYALALAFNEGGARIFDFEGSPRTYKSFNYPATLKKNSLEYALKEIAYPIFLLDLQQAQEDDNAKNILEKAIYMRVIGARYEEKDSKNYFWFPVLESFDGILFFQKSHAAEGIQNKY